MLILAFFYSVDDCSLINLNPINYLNTIPFMCGPQPLNFVHSYSNEEIKQIVFGSILGDGKLS